MTTVPERAVADDPHDLSEDALLAAVERAEPRATTGSIEARPVDRIAVIEGTTCDYLEPSQWVGMSRRRRLGLIRSDSVRFLHRGEPVPLRSALVYLRSFAAGITSGQRSPTTITTRSTRVASPGRFPPPRQGGADGLRPRPTPPDRSR